VEKSLQVLFEANLEQLLGVRFLATEYTTSNGGRIDTLGLDENGSPVIVEYKRASNENVINQGLFYLDWLMDHRKDFQWLALEKLGKEVADSIEWSTPRLLCIAGDFNKYDHHAVKQMPRNIELLRYRRFGSDLLMLELAAASTSRVFATPAVQGKPASALGMNKYKTIGSVIAELDESLTDRLESLKAYVNALGDDVQEATLQFYIAFKRLKNFACVEIRPTTGRILIYVKVDPTTIAVETGFTRDVRGVGHYGTGDLEITLSSADDLERAKPLIAWSYEAS
jgi:predicted transport protein